MKPVRLTSNPYTCERCGKCMVHHPSLGKAWGMNVAVDTIFREPHDIRTAWALGAYCQSGSIHVEEIEMPDQTGAAYA